MKTRHVLFVLVAAFMSAAVWAQMVEAPEPEMRSLKGLVWTCRGNARIEGDRLIVDVPKDKATEGGLAHATFDLSPYAGKGVKLTVRASGREIAPPAIPWLGFKFQFEWQDEKTKARFWPNTFGRTGTFDEQEIFVRAEFEGAQPTKGHFMLGLQSTSGHAEFDLSTLKIGECEGRFVLVNQDRKITYPPTVRRTGQPNLRGVMLPGGPCKEDDFRTLRDWGASLARYQMTRRFAAVGADRDLVEYDTWLDGKLDHLERDVLPWAAKYGIQVIVDLHCPPGGRDEDKDWTMYHHATYASHFISCWRRIATRFKGRREIYGYDLVNEPAQLRRALDGCDYWSLQRRAAEAIRMIDQETPIVVEAMEWDSPTAFRYLSPLDMDNVIYQVHMYLPGQYTHQGVRAGANYTRYSYPDEKQGWNRDQLKKWLAPVRAFELRHKAKILVGEFSAATWAEGAGNYIADCISVFNEYGWDWTYHAFREAKVWDVEYRCLDKVKNLFEPSLDNPRRKALLDGLKAGIR